MQGLPRPIALYVGRVSVDKNLEAFLGMEWKGSKVIVGGGPALQRLKIKFPGAYFLGSKTGSELVAHYRSADIFVFPSLKDTFGLVVIEALACGLAVAAFKDAVGPQDIITQPFLGGLSDNLSEAAMRALHASGTREDRAAYIKANYAWANSADQFSAICKEDIMRFRQAV